MLLPLIVLAVMQQPPAVIKGASTANDLYMDCKAQIAFSNGQQPPNPAALYKSGFCLGFIVGLTDGLVSLHMTCAPDPDPTVLATKYVDYMSRNPNMFVLPMTSGFVGALQEAYPRRTDSENAVLELSQFGVSINVPTINGSGHRACPLSPQSSLCKSDSGCSFSFGARGPAALPT